MAPLRLEYAKAWGERLGAIEARFVENPKKATDATLPPLLLMTFDDEAPSTTTTTTTTKKRCVLAYGHLDVQPAKKEDGWTTADPFVAEDVVDSKTGVRYLRGRGASDDKGPALSWLWALEAHRKLGLPCPVRLQLLFEGMEEYGSLGLPEFIFAEAAKGRDGWLDEVDYVCVSDNTWVGAKTPCLTYGLRGMAYFELQVSGGTLDLHSGTHGGAVASEPLMDLVHLMASLVDPPAGPGVGDESSMTTNGAATVTQQPTTTTNGVAKAKEDPPVVMVVPPPTTTTNGVVKGPRYKPLHERIRIKGILDDVAPVTPAERDKYAAIDFDVDAYRDAGLGGAATLPGADKTELLMSRWRFPTLSVHGIEGAFAEPGAKTVVPGTVKGKFSMRLVPNMTPSGTEAKVRAHVESVFEALGSRNTMKLTCLHAGPSWVSETDHPNYVAGANATRRVHGVEPNLTREGGSIPLANWLEDATKVNVLLLPTGAADDAHHAQNEKYNVTNLVNGIKVLGTYLHEIAKLEGPRPSKCRCAPEPFDVTIVGAFARGFRCFCEI
mmetsp:Transcript_10268/g.41551  ORF Transcript_10268/g.41551 Transcript_10268/m.41551 type:complete len:552 (+) Transcript_10268:249-1904(+)